MHGKNRASFFGFIGWEAFFLSQKTPYSGKRPRRRRTVVHRHISGAGAVSDVVREGLHLRQEGSVPTGHEIRVVFLTGTVLIHDLEQVFGAHRRDPKGAFGANDLGLHVAAGGVGAIGEQEAHGAVVALDHGSGVVGIVQFPVEVKFKHTAQAPDIFDIGAGEPADQIQVVDAHIQELAAGVGCKFQRGLDGAAGGPGYRSGPAPPCRSPRRPPGAWPRRRRDRSGT